MKKIALILLFASMSIAGYSQSGLYFGGKYVFQNTWLFNEDISDDGDIGYKATFNHAFGIELGYMFTENLGLGAEINYSMIGQTYEVSNPLGSSEFSATINYLQIPVLIQFTSNQENSAFFLSSVGPTFHIPLSGQSEFFGQSNDIDKDELASPIGIMLNLGAGFNLMDGLAITTGLRLGYGFSNSFESTDPFGIGGDSPTNLAFGGLWLGARYTLQ